MKVLLAYRCADELAEDPEAATLPSGLPWIACALDRAGHEATLVNFSRLGWKDVDRFLGTAAPDLVGISCSTANRAAAIRLARRVRRGVPGCSVAFGGPHASAVPSVLLERVRELDFVVVGEGELPLVQACAALERGGAPALAGIAGVAVRGPATGAAAAPTSTAPTNWDAPSPPPAGLERAAGLLPERDLRFVVASRERGGGSTRRAPRAIVDELAALRDRAGIVDASLIGPGLLAASEWLDELGEELYAARVAAAWDVQADWRDVAAAAHESETALLRALRSAHRAGLRRVRVLVDVEQDGAEARAALAETARVLHAAGPAPHLTLRVGSSGRNVDVELGRAVIRAFRPREGRIEIRELLPGTVEWSEIAASEGLTDAYWFDEDRPVIPLPSPRQAEVATAALEATLREVSRSAQPAVRDLDALERATGSAAWTHLEWGDYRARLGDRDEAERRFRLAAADQPWSPFPWSRLAALFRRGRDADGERELAALRQVLQRVPAHPETRRRVEELQPAAPVRRRRRAGKV